MPGGSQDRRDHRTRRTLALRPGHMHGGKSLVRVADQRQQHTHPFELEVARRIRLDLHTLIVDAVVQELDGLSVSLDESGHDRPRFLALRYQRVFKPENMDCERQGASRRFLVTTGSFLYGRDHPSS